MIAREQKRNWFFALFYTLLTALSGGTVHDILLTQRSIFWLRTPGYVWLATTAELLTFMLAGMTSLRREQLWLVDELSLAIFTVIVAQVVLQIAALDLTSFRY